MGLSRHYGKITFEESLGFRLLLSLATIWAFYSILYLGGILDKNYLVIIIFGFLGFLIFYNGIYKTLNHIYLRRNDKNFIRRLISYNSTTIILIVLALLWNLFIIFILFML